MQFSISQVKQLIFLFGAIAAVLLFDVKKEASDYLGITEQWAAGERRGEQLEALASSVKVIANNVSSNVAAVTSVTQKIDQLTKDLAYSISRIEEMEAEKKASGLPAIDFTRRGHKVSDGRIGGIVVFEWHFYLLRECGAPIIDLYMINGDGLSHRFQDISIASPSGRGISFEVDREESQFIKYTARIPKNEGITPGRGLARVSVSHAEGCPGTPIAESPFVSFEILPEL